MKRLICICLMLLVIAGLSLSVGAEGEPRAVLASSENVRQGKTVAISVTVSSTEEVYGYVVELVYDKTVFDLVGGTWQLDDKPPFLRESDRDTFQLYTPAVPGNSPILTFTLRAKQDAELDLVTEVSCNVGLLTLNGELPAAVQPVNIKINCPHTYTKNETVEYLKSAATCTEPAVYYKSCSKCGIIDESQTFISGEALQHNFKDREMTKYLAEAGDCQNRNIYFVSCVACGIAGEQTFEGRTLGEHVYDHDCDKKCNVCFDERTITHVPVQELSSDEKGHWYECSICQGKVDLAAHTPGPEPTPDTPQTCTDCGFVLKVHQEHVHDFGDQWLCDEDSHWQQCACGEASEVQPHQWDTADPQLHTCQICGQTKQIPLPPTEPTQPTTPVQPEEPAKPLNLPAMVLGLVLIASLAGNVILVLFLMKARKRG